MPPLTRLLERADYFLLIAGAALGLFVIARLLWNRRLGEALRLPPTTAAPTDARALTAFDLVVAFAGMVLLPAAAHTVLSMFMPDAAVDIAATATAPATSMPPMDAPQTGEASDARAPTLIETLSVTIGQTGAFLLFIAVVRGRLTGGLAAWGLELRTLPGDLARAAVGFLGIWPWCLALLLASVAIVSWAWPDFEMIEHETITLLMSDQTPAPVRWLTFFNALVVAAVVEECFFRGMVQPVLVQAIGDPWKSIVLTGVVFGVFHYPMVQTFAPLALLGVAAGYAYARSGSLLLAICLHMVFNAKTLIWLALGADMAPAS